MKATLDFSIATNDYGIIFKLWFQNLPSKVDRCYKNCLLLSHCPSCRITTTRGLPQISAKNCRKFAAAGGAAGVPVGEWNETLLASAEPEPAPRQALGA
jgi:hypothetical protein